MREARTKTSFLRAQGVSSHKQDHTKAKFKKERLMDMEFISLLMERRDAREHGNEES